MPQGDPLSTREKQDLINYLKELKTARALILLMQDDQQREQERDARDAESWQMRVDAEKRMTAAAERERDVAIKERDLALDQKQHFEDMVKVLTKKRGFWSCFAKKIRTLGFGSCGI